MEWNNTKTHLVLRAGVNLGGIKRRDVSKLRSVLVVAIFRVPGSVSLFWCRTKTLSLESQIFSTRDRHLSLFSKSWITSRLRISSSRAGGSELAEQKMLRLLQKSDMKHPGSPET